MTTKMKIFSSLVLTAATLFVVPLSSEEASANGRFGGARSFGVVRTSPIVISRAVSTSVHKLSSTSAVSHRKLNTTQAGAKLKNSQTALKAHNLREVEKGNKDKDKHKDRDSDKDKDRDRDSGKDKDRDRDRGKDKDKDKDKDPGKDHGGTIEKEKPPVVILERPRPIYPAVGIGAVPAAVVVDAPGCVYERSVRKLPGGGLQRVIVKICPDA